jgi:hypothetical protein
MVKRINHNFLSDISPLVTFDINQGSPLVDLDTSENGKFEDSRSVLRLEVSGKDSVTNRDSIAKDIVLSDSSMFSSNVNNNQSNAREKGLREPESKYPKKLKGLEKDSIPDDVDNLGGPAQDRAKKIYADPLSLPPKDGMNKRTGKAIKNKKGPPVKIFKLAGDSEACIEIGKDFVRIKAGDGSFIIINKSSINAGTSNMNWQMSPEQITYHGLLNQANPIMGMFPISPKYLLTAGPIIALANAFRTNVLIGSAVGIIV